MYVGTLSGGNCVVEDRWSTVKKEPIVDAKQNVLSPACSESNGRTSITFSRRLSTGDTLNDLNVLNKNVLLQWAYGASDDTSELHRGTGSAMVNFLAGLPPAATTTILTTTTTPSPYVLCSADVGASLDR
jgi:hypothetical protein